MCVSVCMYRHVHVKRPEEERAREKRESSPRRERKTPCFLKKGKKKHTQTHTPSLLYFTYTHTHTNPTSLNPGRRAPTNTHSQQLNEQAYPAFEAEMKKKMQERKHRHTSEFGGVSFDAKKEKWMAQASEQGKPIHLGTSESVTVRECVCISPSCHG